MAFPAFDSFRQAAGRFKGDFWAFTTGQLGEEFCFFQKSGRSLGPPVLYGHEKEAPPPGIPDRPDGIVVFDFGDALEGAESGHPASVNLSDRLGGSDANACSIVGSGTRSDDNRGELLVVRQIPENFLQWTEEVALLRSFALKGFSGPNSALIG
jgi:hypothetical protein